MSPSSAIRITGEEKGSVLYEIAREHTSPLTSERQRQPLILVVDDDRMHRLQLREELESIGYQVEEATDGKTGIKAYLRHQPDLVLLDAVMPQMDGFTCCNYLQNLPGVNHSPVLMITSLDDQASVDRAFAVGATDYIMKPIHWPVLLQRIRRILQTRRTMGELQQQIHRQRVLTAQLEATNNELQRLASLDGLTQIANRRCFDQVLQAEWQRMRREQMPLSLILCDLDHFKRYNDTYGHLAGDDCLRQVAQLIQKMLKRPADLAARFGGEEFVVLLPYTKQEGAVYLANLIRATISEMVVLPVASDEGGITLSLGVATRIPDTDSTPEQLIAEADQALYEAKSRGRNQVVVFSEIQPS